MTQKIKEKMVPVEDLLNDVVLQLEESLKDMEAGRVKPFRKTKS